MQIIYCQVNIAVFIYFPVLVCRYAAKFIFNNGQHYMCFVCITHTLNIMYLFLHLLC